MKLLPILVPSLLVQAAEVLGRAAPAAVPRQLSHSEPSDLNPLVLRAASTSTTTATITTTAAPVSSSSAAEDADNVSTTDTDIYSTTSVQPVASVSPTGPRNHNVAVGQNGTQFTPTSLKNITVGDTLTFYFYPSNYSIVQSSFGVPCEPMKENGGVDQKAIFSGFHECVGDIATEKFVVTVKSTETMWIYAVDGNNLASKSAANACEKGMVMVINPLPREKAAGETLNTYRKNAAAFAMGGKEQCPPHVWGGEIKPISDKEKARWESKHPLGGNPPKVSNSTDGVSGNGTGVASFQNNANVMGRGNSLMAVAVLVGACVFEWGL